MIDLATWSSYRSEKNDQERREHILIDFARQTALWPQQLETFETEIRKANAAAMKLLKSGVRINLETEQYLWREAHHRWKAIWDLCVEETLTGKRHLIPLTAVLAAHYEGLAGVRIPTEDQVIAFYMTGGVTDDADAIRNAGNRIQVPEWVMRAHLRRSKLVELRHSPANPQPAWVLADPVRNIEERIECKFVVQIVDTYAPYPNTGANNPVLRGKLIVFIQRPGPDDLEPEAVIDVKLNNRSFPVHTRADRTKRVTVDLADVYRSEILKGVGSLADLLVAVTDRIEPLKFEIGFARKRPADLNPNYS